MQQYLAPVFTYGTLQEQEIQQILFGRVLTMQRVMLFSWSIYVSAENGYLFIKPDPIGKVAGKLLFLDKTALHKADQWEEVPQLYQRENVEIELEDGSKLAAWVYTRRHADGLLYTGTQLSLANPETVIQAVQSSLSRRPLTVEPAEEGSCQKVRSVF